MTIRASRSQTCPGSAVAAYLESYTRTDAGCVFTGAAVTLAPGAGAGVGLIQAVGEGQQRSRIPVCLTPFTLIRT